LNWVITLPGLLYSPVIIEVEREEEALLLVTFGEAHCVYWRTGELMSLHNQPYFSLSG